MKRELNPKFVESQINNHLKNIENEMKEIRKYLKRMYYFEES